MNAAINLKFRDYYRNYTQHKQEIRRLLREIIVNLASETVLHDQRHQRKAMESMIAFFPFVNLLYVLDEDGIQVSNNITVSEGGKVVIMDGFGEDRSRRPYYLEPGDEGGMTYTEPYISTASYEVCISVALRWNKAVRDGGAVQGQNMLLVLDCDLTRLLDMLPDYSAVLRH